MSTYTNNINLKKPLGTEHFSRIDLNDNFDKIDSAFLAKMTFKGSVALIADLPVSNAIADFYFVLENNKFYIWNGSTWLYQIDAAVDFNNVTLTGIPNAPTADVSINNTQIATTAFVHLLVAALVGSSPAALDTLNELATALGNDPNFATTITNLIATKQAQLVNQTNIKSINNESLLDSGNIDVATLDDVKEIEQDTTQTASFTLDLTQKGQQLICSSTSEIVVTVPANSSVAFPLGSMILLLRYNTGDVTFLADSGVTIRSADSALSIASQYQVASLIKIGTDEWSLFGALA